MSVSLKDSNIIYTASGHLFQNNKFTVARASHSPCIETFFSRNIYAGSWKMSFVKIAFNGFLLG